MVDKPPFLLIHPSKPDGTPTLWAALRELLAFELVNGGQVSIVNRLDRETSGLVLIAKNAEAARRFGRAMERRRIEKEYLAIVHGWPEWDNTRGRCAARRQGEHGPSAIWLETDDSRKRAAAAVTEFRVEKRFVRQRAEIVSRSSVRSRRLGGPIRSVCISRTSVIPLSATKFTGLTKSSICGSSRPAGLMNSGAAAVAAARAPFCAVARGRTRLAKSAPARSGGVDRSRRLRVLVPGSARASRAQSGASRDLFGAGTFVNHPAIPRLIVCGEARALPGVCRNALLRARDLTFGNRIRVPSII